jgi:hypothetical protein
MKKCLLRSLSPAEEVFGTSIRRRTGARSCSRVDVDLARQARPCKLMSTAAVFNINLSL